MKTFQEIWQERNPVHEVNTDDGKDMFWKTAELCAREFLMQFGDGIPVEEGHICFQNGHSMFSVYTLHNHQSSWGKHKCSRCGYEEDWQYDFPNSHNLMHHG